jgi:hypothetical protein
MVDSVPKKPEFFSMKRETVLLLFALACRSVHGSDWPHLLGPTRDAVYAGPALADKWPANGPRVVWKLDVGEGCSSPVVADGFAYIKGPRQLVWVDLRGN